jgi:hypothetical protein
MPDVGDHRISGGCGRQWSSKGLRHHCRAARGAPDCRCPCGNVFSQEAEDSERLALELRKNQNMDQVTLAMLQEDARQHIPLKTWADIEHAALTCPVRWNRP